jgi:2-desacetyl-2-hydroxyethyl bacteriochlorophyllide A dehydrogenase
MKAKRLVFTGRLRVETEEFDLPDSPGPEDVLVENLYGLISPGTELAMFMETHIGFPIPEFRYAKYPFRPGYASVGRALVVGRDVKGVREGDLLFTRSNHASHAVVQAGRPRVKLPEGLPAEHAPFASLAQISLTAVRLSEAYLGQTVAVFGQGLIGNFAAQLMRCAGARRVIGVDLVDERLEISRRCGVDVRANPDREDVRKRVDELTGGRGCQIVVEATGNPEVAPWAIRMAAQMGKVVLLGSPRGNAEISLYFGLHSPGVTLIGAHPSRQADAARYGDPEPYDLMLSFIAEGRLRVAPLLTHVLPASDAERAYRGLMDEKDKYLGVLLKLSEWG